MCKMLSFLDVQYAIIVTFFLISQFSLMSHGRKRYDHTIGMSLT